VAATPPAGATASPAPLAGALVLGLPLRRRRRLTPEMSRPDPDPLLP